MKGIKLSKASWLILSAGVFVVILAGLGVTRSQQLREETSIKEELSASQTLLDKMNVTDLRRQQADLQQRVDQGTAQLNEAKERLRQTVVSVDVIDELFKIADYSGVTIKTLSNSNITTVDLDGISLAKTSLSINANGDLDKVIDFVVNLNNGYSTGYVSSAQISVQSSDPGAAGDGGSTGEEGTQTGSLAESGARVSIQMVVYSYEGE